MDLIRPALRERFRGLLSRFFAVDAQSIAQAALRALN